MRLEIEAGLEENSLYPQCNAIATLAPLAFPLARTLALTTRAPLSPLRHRSISSFHDTEEREKKRRAQWNVELAPCCTSYTPIFPPPPLPGHGECRDERELQAPFTVTVLFLLSEEFLFPCTFAQMTEQFEYLVLADSEARVFSKVFSEKREGGVRQGTVSEKCTDRRKTDK